MRALLRRIGAAAFVALFACAAHAQLGIGGPILGSTPVNWAAPGPIGSGTPNTGVFTTLTAQTSFTLGSSSDTFLVRDAANTIAQRNGTNAQLFTSYNTFTDASNYERAEVGWNPGGLGANFVGLVTKSAGTGTARDLYLGTIGNSAIRFIQNNTERWRIGSAGLLASTDNSIDVGAVGATRPRTYYAGTSFIGPLFRSDSAKVLLQGTGTGATQLSATQTTAPTCTTNCGSPGNVCVGTDTSMVCTMGTTPASGFVINFNGTWAATPSCVGQAALAGMATGKKPLTVVPSTTIITVTTDGTAPVAGDKYAILCMGVQ